MKPSFLSIFLPSYKRPAALLLQVSSLLDQWIELDASLRELVSIHVRLNGACDHDSQLLASLERQSLVCEAFSFACNPVNIGGNANIALGFTVACPDGYVWILSDNDLVRNNLLSDILSQLLRFSPDVLINCGGRYPDPSLRILAYRDIGNLWDHPLYGLGLISRGVYSLKYLNCSGLAPFLYHNSSFPHLAAIFSAFKLNQSCRLIELPGEAFVPKSADNGDYVGSYAMSYAGRAQLIELIPPSRRRAFAASFLRSGSLDLLRSLSRYPSIAISSFAILMFYAPLATLISFPLTLTSEIFTRMRVRLRLV